MTLFFATYIFACVFFVFFCSSENCLKLRSIYCMDYKQLCRYDVTTYRVSDMRSLRPLAPLRLLLRRSSQIFSTIFIHDYLYWYWRIVVWLRILNSKSFLLHTILNAWIWRFDNMICYVCLACFKTGHFSKCVVTEWYLKSLQIYLVKHL